MFRRLLASAAGLDRARLVEAFVAFNLAFLALDIYVAHSVNMFRHPAEWIPFFFCLAAAPAVAALLVLRGRVPPRARHRGGLAIGAAAILVGIAGMIWHLESQFFEATTLRSLAYSAPFLAPLAFAGLGFLLLLDRLAPHDGLEWGLWVVFLAWAGFVGNFGLSLLDHAQNGFFFDAEWIPVGAAAFAVAFLLLPLLGPQRPGVYAAILALLGVQALVGVLGFVLHVTPAVAETSGTLGERIIYGAPVFAPLLFPNIALLAALGVWDVWAKGHVAEREPGPREPDLRA